MHGADAMRNTLSAEGSRHTVGSGVRALVVRLLSGGIAGCATVLRIPPSMSTVPLGRGGTMLRSTAGRTLNVEPRPVGALRVLVEQRE